jgi:hypothetical protein
MEEHHPGRQNSRSFFRMALRSIFCVCVCVCFAIHFRRYCGSLLHESHHQRSFHFPEKVLAFWQADNVCLSLFGLFGECVFIRCFDCFLISTFTNESQVLSSFTPTILLRNSSPSLCYHGSKVKAEAIHCLLCAPMSIFGNHLAKN